MNDDIAIQVLATMYDQQQRDQRPDAGSIARDLGVRATRVAEAILHLERRGLVDAGRARLTMTGLAAAAALSLHARRAPLSRAA